MARYHILDSIQKVNSLHKDYLRIYFVKNIYIKVEVLA